MSKTETWEIIWFENKTKQTKKLAPPFTFRPIRTSNWQNLIRSWLARWTYDDCQVPSLSNSPIPALVLCDNLRSSLKLKLLVWSLCNKAFSKHSSTKQPCSSAESRQTQQCTCKTRTSLTTCYLSLHKPLPSHMWWSISCGLLFKNCHVQSMTLTRHHLNSLDTHQFKIKDLNVTSVLSVNLKVKISLCI